MKHKKYSTSVSVLLPCLALVTLLTFAQAQEAENPREAFNQAMAEFQALSVKRLGDEEADALREKIIRLSLSLEPPVPKEARQPFILAVTLHKEAKETEDYAPVIAEYRKALDSCPWFADAYYNLGIVQKLAGQYGDALRSLRLYLIAAPDAGDAEAVKGRIYEIEYKQEKKATLSKAVLARDTAEVERLLGKGADVNARAENGMTALMRAAYIGNTEIARVLLDAGADVNAKTESGVTALMWAAWTGHTETVKVLIDAGADVNVKDMDGWTALKWAAKGGNAEVVKILKQARARR